MDQVHGEGPLTRGLCFVLCCEDCEPHRRKEAAFSPLISPLTLDSYKNMTVVNVVYNNLIRKCKIYPTLKLTA